jgi:hypothetical protein
MSGPLN